MGKTFHRPEALAETITHYCPGCTHGVAHRLVAEVIDELGVRGKTVGIAPVGCAVVMYNYFTFDLLKDSVRDEFSGKKTLIPINLEAMGIGRQAA